MKYQLGKQYFIGGHYWTPSMMTSEYVTLERVDKPSVWKTVRI